MDDSTLYGYYFLGLGIAVVIILAAAILLLLVRHYARRILKLATAALGIVVQVKENTNSIWGLKQTNIVAGDILEGANAIKSHAVLVAEALADTEEK